MELGVVLIGFLILVLLASLAWKLLLTIWMIRAERDEAKKQLKTLGLLPVAQLESKRLELERQIAEQSERLSREKSEAATALELREKAAGRGPQIYCRDRGSCSPTGSRHLSLSSSSDRRCRLRKGARTGPKSDRDHR